MNKLYRLKYWPSWFGSFVLRLISRMPATVRHTIAKYIANFAWKVNHKRRGIVLLNLQHCFPEIPEQQRISIGREHFQCMSRSMLDQGQIWFASQESLRTQVYIDGWENIEQSRAAGKNIILNAIHNPALDLGGIYVSIHAETVGFYKKAKNPVLDVLMTRGRIRFGGRLIERSEGLLAVIRALKKGKILYTLSDEDHGPKHSVYAPFFGRQKATLPMVGRLAKAANANVLPMSTRYDIEKKQYIITILPPIEGLPSGNPETDALLLNQSMEQLIKMAPAEYMWTMKLFKTQPDENSIYDKI